MVAECYVRGVSTRRVESLVAQLGIEPTHVVERLLALAVPQPTLSACQLSDRAGGEGCAISKTTVAKVICDHGLSSLSSTRRAR